VSVIICAILGFLCLQLYDQQVLFWGSCVYSYMDSGAILGSCVYSYMDSRCDSGAPLSMKKRTAAGGCMRTLKD